MALASLFKGIVAAVIVFIVVGIDVLLRHHLRRYVTFSFLMAFLAGTVLFSLPFILSAYFPDANFVANKNSGLYLVYKENFVRFFKPFDHVEPFYSYFIYLPLYLFPWIIFFVPALYNRIRSWSQLELTSRWALLSFLVLFAFFTLSGSRRSYYILPVVPFALLVIIDWLQATPRFLLPAKWLAVLSTGVLLLFFTVAQPIFYHYYGLTPFLQQVMNQVPGDALQKSDIAMFDVRNKIAFYAGLPPTAIYRSHQQVDIVIQQYARIFTHSQSYVGLPRLILTTKEHVVHIQTMLPAVYETTLEPPLLRIHGKVMSARHEVVALIRRA